MWSLLAVIIYVVVFLIMRLKNIDTFPLFIDEIAHIFLADITLDGNVFAGLHETHKQIYIWLVALSFLLFNDPIYVARVVSVLAGLISAGICYKLTNMFYPERKIGYLAALFYLVSPFAVLFDRMALADGLQSMLMGASLLASFRLWQSSSYRWALISGIAFGLATFNKGYAILYYPTPILLWLLLGRDINWRKIIKLLAITYAIASVAWILLIGIGWHIYVRDIATKSIVNSPDENNFFIRVWDSAQLITGWLGIYLTLPLVGLIIFAIVRIIITWNKPGLVLLFLITGSLFIFSTAFVELRSRYLFPLIIPLSVIVAWGIAELVKIIFTLFNRIRHKNEILLSKYLIPFQVALFSALSIAPLLFSYLIVTQPILAPFPEEDWGGYAAGGQSTQGYRETAQIMEYLMLYKGKLIFLRYSLPSPLEIMLSVYLSDWVLETMDIVPIGSYEQITPPSLTAYAQQAPTLTADKDFITANDANPIIHFPLWRIASFSNPKRPSTIGIYQWLLPPDFAVRWFQQGGDANPRIAWQPADMLITTSKNALIDWPQTSFLTPEAMQQTLVAENIEYILLTPALVKQQAGLFAPFMTTAETSITINQIPPGWYLSFAYPDLNCEWCLFQLRPPDNPIRAMFGETIQLEGYDVSLTQSPPEGAIYITLYWHNTAPIPQSYVVFVHLLDENGNLVGQIDEMPLVGQWPTNSWPAGTRLADRHALPLDPDLPLGDYTILVGLYNPLDLARLPVQSEENSVLDNTLVLTNVSICYECFAKE